MRSLPTPALKLYPGEIRALLAVAGLAALFALLIAFDLFGAYLMKKIQLAAALAVAALSLTLGGCAATGGAVSALGVLQAAGLTVDAYCGLAPEGRAEIRRKIGLKARLIACPGDAPAAGLKTGDLVP
ncbi:hypothetical protein [Phenylobacterium sp.]|uniref:hypothetical protein n=1 Tax=Phenylobacterium sp. TaxID=1871053 RepID=UPI00396CB99A